MRFTSALFAMTCLSSAFCGAASAQDMERMIVTANRIDDVDMRSAPAVYRQIPADFVLVAVTFQSATRDTAERSKELETMFNRLKAKAAKTDGFSLAGGELGQSTSDIDTVLFTDVYRADYSGTGRFTLTLNIDTRKDESFERLMARAKTFVEEIQTAGRSEAYLGDDQFIGARDVAKHRADLVADIAAEVKGLQAAFAPASVTLTGLESRIITQPSGPLELEIFIPYTLVLESGNAD
ncbi:MAG: hypothetical protein IPK75_01695 [Acidobacteria bacterium]|nr:hypothetical protein [Acidobacteriota bacterium]